MDDSNLICIGGVWKVRYQINGKQRQQSLGTRSRKEALRLRRGVLAEVRLRREGKLPPEEPPRPRFSWDDVVKEYEASERFRALGEETRTRYRIDLRRVGAFLVETGRRPGEIDDRAVREFVADMREDDLSTSTIKNALTPFNLAMKEAVRAGLVERNPVRDYERADLGDDAPPMDPPLGGEFERLLPEVPDDLRDFVDFLHRTGCRATETLLAQADDLLPSDRLHLRRGVKMGRPRTIYLNAAAELLDRLPQRGRLFPHLSEDVAVVSAQWGRFLTARAEAERAAAAAEGREPDPWKLRRWRLHDHRHAFAINAILAMANIFLLSRHLGHQSVSTTMGYLKAIDRLPVDQRGGLRLPTPRRPGTRGPVDGDGEQPEFDLPLRHAGGPGMFEVDTDLVLPRAGRRG